MFILLVCFIISGGGGGGGGVFFLPLLNFLLASANQYFMNLAWQWGTGNGLN